MNRTIILVSGCMLMAANSAALRAQGTKSDTLAIESTVAAYVRDSLRVPGGVTFDARTYRSGTSIGERSQDRAAALTAAGGTLAHRDEALLCEASSRAARCRLTVANFVTIEEPDVKRQSATVRVTVMRRTNTARVPIDRTEYRLTLRRSGTRWIVASCQVEGQS